MTYTSLISTRELSSHLYDPNWVTVDCRFFLADPGRGYLDYQQSHIAGAVYAHLDNDLSAEFIPGVTGRHPWPSVEAASQIISNLGISQDTQVVVYDNASGALPAVRLWWMLRWLGHEPAAVLDGGWSKWVADNLATIRGRETRENSDFHPHPRPELLVSTQEVNVLRMDPEYRLFDARALERYNGQNETIDPVAGHIPGAVSAPYLDNLTPTGEMLPVSDLRAHYQTLLSDIPVERTVFYCGSGVTAIHNILAILYAGLGEARLYAGSWSEWITDPKNPVAS